MFGHDPELPNGFQDADLEMREFEEEAERLHRSEKRFLSTNVNELGRMLSDSTLDIPKMRREVLTINMRWLRRNIKIQNAHHKNVDCILDLIHRLLDGELKDAWEFQSKLCTHS